MHLDRPSIEAQDNSRQTLPTFLGIGAMRAGSTWLHHNLALHPSVWMPPFKEIHYFDLQKHGPFFNKRYRSQLRKRLKNYARIRGFSRRQFKWDVNYFFSRRTDTWYQSIFDPDSEQIAGEITPKYALLSQESIKEIYQLNPDLRILFIMRNPIERTWSHVVKDFAKDRGRHIDECDDDAILKKIKGGFGKSRCDYLSTLRNWESSFKREQIFIGFFEEIERSPERLLSKIFNFLGIDDRMDFIRSNSLVRRFNSNDGYTKPIPPKIKLYLTRQYFDMLKSQHELFGDHASEWYRNAIETLKQNNVTI